MGKEVLDEKLKILLKNINHLKIKKMTKSEMGDQVIFNYQATVDNKEFEGSEGKECSYRIRKRFIF